MDYYYLAYQIKQSLLHYFIQIMAQRPPQNPIPLSTFIEYYLEEATLRRPKSELIAEIKDVITISQYLIAKIPSTQKSMREGLRIQFKAIKDLSEKIKMTMRNIIDDPKYMFCVYTNAAYDELSDFSFDRELDNDFWQNAIAEKEMKLKFLESENLPKDFFWTIPSSNSAHSKVCSYYNSKYKMIEISTTNFSIFVTMRAQNSQYKWMISDIRHKILSENLVRFIHYFETKVVPAIKKKSPQNHEENMLQRIDKLAYYLDLLQFQEIATKVFQSEDKSDNYPAKLSHTLNGNKYVLTFPKLQNYEDSVVTIINEEKQQFVLEMQFNKKFTKAEFHAKQMKITFCTRQQFRYENPMILLSIMEILVDFAERLTLFKENYFHEGKTDIHVFNSFLFMKVNGQIWVNSQMQEHFDRKKTFALTQDCILVAAEKYGKYVFALIGKEGTLQSRKITKHFFHNYLTKHADLTTLHCFIYVIEQLLSRNSKPQTQSQLDSYTIYNPNPNKADVFKVCLYFRRRIAIQQTMLKYTDNRINYEQDVFLNMRCVVQVNLGFQQTVVNIFRQYQNKHHYVTPQWTEYISQKPKQALLDCSKFLKFVQYVSHNIVLKYAYERRMFKQGKNTISMLI